MPFDAPSRKGTEVKLPLRPDDAARAHFPARRLGLLRS